MNRLQGVPVVGNEKPKVEINITKHIKTFINPNNGKEITREEALGKKAPTNNEGEHSEKN